MSNPAREDPVIQFNENYLIPQKPAPLSYWTDKNASPPGRLTSEFRNWRMANTENVPRFKLSGPSY